MASIDATTLAPAQGGWLARLTRHVRSVVGSNASRDIGAELLLRPTKRDFEKSRIVYSTEFQMFLAIADPSRYNGFRKDAEQPPIEDHLSSLARLFVRYGVEKDFCVHLLHNHSKIERGKVAVGKSHEQPRGRYTRRVKIRNLDPSTVHGHVFALGEDGNLHPSEFQDGRIPDSFMVNRVFLAEFVKYLEINDLGKVLGLEVIDQPYHSEMTEIEINDGTIMTVMMEARLLKGCSPYRQTSWRFEDMDGIPRVCKDGTQSHGTGPNGHITSQSKFVRPESFECVWQQVQKELC